MANSLAVTGHSTAFTPELFRQVRANLFLPFSALFGLGVVGVILRDKVDQFFSSLKTDLHQMLRDAVKSFRSRMIESEERWIFAGIALTGVVMRLAVLNQPIRNDEAVSYIEIASKSLRVVLMDQWSRFHALNNILIYFSTHIFGNAEWTIRLPVFIAGSAVVILTLWLGASLFSGKVGAFAGALVAVAWPMVEYSANARGYMLGTVFMLASFHLLDYASRTDNKAAWVVGGIVAALSSFCVSTMVVPLLAIALWLAGIILTERRLKPGVLVNRAILTTTVTLAAMFALYFPYWIVLGPLGLFTVPDCAVPPTGVTFLPVLASFLGSLQPLFDWALPNSMALCVEALAIFGLLSSSRATLLSGGMLVAAISFLILSHYVPIPYRGFTPYIPFYALFIGCGVCRLESYLPKFSILITFVMTVITLTAGYRALNLPEVYFSDVGFNPNMQKNAQQLMDRLAPGEAAVGEGLATPLIYDVLRKSHKQGRHFIYATAPVPGSLEYGMLYHCPDDACSNRPLSYTFLSLSEHTEIPAPLAQLSIRHVMQID